MSDDRSAEELRALTTSRMTRNMMLTGYALIAGDMLAGPRAGDPIPEPVKSRKVQAGRNDPCPCGSGIKFKKCCLNKKTAPAKSE